MAGEVLYSVGWYYFTHAYLLAGYVLLIGTLVYVLVTEYVRYRARIKGLSGPRGYPLVGNIPQIRVNAAEQYRKWAQEFDSVYQIMLGNVPVVVINSAKAAKAIFSSNSQALSSRPEFYTFHKIVSSTAGTTIGTSPFSDSLKRRRKGAASALNKPSVMTYTPYIDVESRTFIRDFLEHGEAGKASVDPVPTIQRLSLSLGLTLNWGIRMESQHDQMFAEITEVEQALSGFRSTTGNLQDYIPILRLNPFSAGRARAREMRRRRDVYLKKLNDDLEDRMRRGVHKPCIQANVIQDKDARLNAAELTSISLTMLNAGLDTLATLISWSIALLAERKDVQDKALKAIREVYPTENILCAADDDQSIPYIVALVREFLRYFSVLRLNLPRASVREVMYNGVRLPAGTVFFLNAWACNMDPEVWGDDALSFRPERWLEQPDAPIFSYGVGYRMCAGSLLASREMYTIFLRLISAFEIKDAESLGPGKVDTHPVTGVEDQRHLVSAPRKYKVRFVPRDENVLREALMEEV